MGRTFEEHLSNLEGVFARIHEAGFKIKPAKCFFLRERVQYLGYIVSKDAIEADPDKLCKVHSWPTPRNVREVQQFLGLANYYRRFIKNFVKWHDPYTDLLSVRLPPFNGQSNAKGLLTRFMNCYLHLLSSAILTSCNLSIWTLTPATRDWCSIVTA